MIQNNIVLSYEFVERVCRMRNVFSFILVVVVLISFTQADELPPGVVNTQNPADVSLTPTESLARLSVPDGFHATLFAAEPAIRRPIAFDFDDKGRLWVVENYSHPKWKKDGSSDRIVILEDTDQDGEFDKRKVFWDKGRYLTGIAVGHGGVWLANTPELTFIPDRNGDDVPDSEPVAMLDGFQISSNNVVNNLHWGPDGWLYGAIGLSSRSTVGTPGASDGQRVDITRGIWRFHPVKHVFEKVAEGMVNPWGADFNEFGDLITSNTVIAHLWHIVPGMYCARRASERDNPYAYSRIQTIANHLHWGGGGWQSSRSPGSSRKKTSKKPKSANSNNPKPHSDDHDSEYHQHSVAGGGHAHCGGMVYLGDNWPEKYRGSFFTNNLHGNRVNNDRLLPAKSSYVGAHSDDLIFANDPWFRGMSIKYGPDGGVYISDWHDIGECHDGDGSHRSSGRIYKVVYGETDNESINLVQQSGKELAKLHVHPNEWQVRHARRILHERFAVGTDLTEAVSTLNQMFDENADEQIKLRCLWSLHVMGELDEARLLQLTRHDNLHIRRWAIRFLVDHQPCDTSPQYSRTDVPIRVVTRFVELAKQEPSAKVRLELACALQRIPSALHRFVIARGLLSHVEDAADPYLPLMIWHGIEPKIADHAAESLSIARDAKIPLVRQYIARRMIEHASSLIDTIVVAALDDDSDAVRLDLMQGILAGVGGKGSRKPPAQWDAFYQQIRSSDNSILRSVGVQLATVFGDQQAIAGLVATALNTKLDPVERQAALRSLLQLGDAASVEMLHQLVSEVSPATDSAKDSGLKVDAIAGLMTRNQPSTPGVLLSHYASLTHAEKQSAISVLATRQTFVEQLLAAIENGQVQRTDVSAFDLLQLRSFKDQNVQNRAAAIWADDAQRLSKADQIARFTKLMTPDHMEQGSASAGRLVFDRTCAKCHTLFGEGGTIAPNLTGSGRTKTDYVLRNLIEPSAEIDAAYRLTTVVTTDGRLLNGFMVQQDDNWLVFRTQDAQIRLAMKDVDELSTNNISMMPEGMLGMLTDEQVRDLLVYLASPEQVALP